MIGITAKTAKAKRNAINIVEIQENDFAIFNYGDNITHTNSGMA